MSALRLLALSYIVCATVFCMAALLRSHPDPGGSLRAAALSLRNAALDQLHQHDVAPLDGLDHPASYRIAIKPLAPGEERLLPRKSAKPLPPRAVAGADDRLNQPEYSGSTTISILPDLSPESAPVPPEPRMEQPEPQFASPRAPQAAMPQFDIARQDARPFRIPEPPSEFGPRATAAAMRLKAGLTPEMLQNFELFIYVSKAERGPLAQRLYVFRKTAGDNLVLLYDWAASTGRERDEVNVRGRRSFTSTPAGYYQFDPARMYRRYHSYSWDQPMPNAMFFNWEREGLATGLAIHAATGDDIAKLGMRASAGCVHLSPENAATLYALIREQYRGAVPRFAYNSDTQTMTNKGGFAHRRDGSLKMADGYKVLINIEDYAGSNLVASLN